MKIGDKVRFLNEIGGGIVYLLVIQNLNGKDILILPLHTEVGEQMSASGISLAVRYIIRPCLTRWKMLI